MSSPPSLESLQISSQPKEARDTTSDSASETPLVNGHSDKHGDNDIPIRAEAAPVGQSDDSPSADKPNGVTVKPTTNGDSTSTEAQKHIPASPSQTASSQSTSALANGEKPPPPAPSASAVPASLSRPAAVPGVSAPAIAGRVPGQGLRPNVGMQGPMGMGMRGRGGISQAAPRLPPSLQAKMDQVSYIPGAAMFTTYQTRTDIRLQHLGQAHQDQVHLPGSVPTRMLPSCRPCCGRKLSEEVKVGLEQLEVAVVLDQDQVQRCQGFPVPLLDLWVVWPRGELLRVDRI